MAQSELFLWETQPRAATWLNDHLAQWVEANSYLKEWRDRLLAETGSRLADWLDHLAVAGTLTNQLREIGYQPEQDAPSKTTMCHPAGMFPRIRLLPNGVRDRLALQVDSVDDFLAANAKQTIEIQGAAGGPLRQARVCECPTLDLWIVERHGTRAFDPTEVPPEQVAAAESHRQVFLARQRTWASNVDGFQDVDHRFRAAAAEIGTGWACDLFFQAERAYWLSRNQAASVQWKRQQRLGLGWANHDHHTYRSSRPCFHLLIASLEGMGFVCRERFYAGHEAGWGAQVLEQPACGIVVFADVDLSPEEIRRDFAHIPLPGRSSLGTVGLWCELHGEAFLQAGMHHLECQFDFDAVRRQLADLEVETMAPFTDFPHLKQAFTKGESWSVAADRIAAAQQQGLITEHQAAHFLRNGALGSHLEILERNDGYKGFNQTGISEIITRTDPRQAME